MEFLLGLFALGVLVAPWIFVFIFYKRLDTLQRRVDVLQFGRSYTVQPETPLDSTPSVAPEPILEPTPEAIPEPIPVPLPRTKTSRSNAEWEMLIGGKLLNRIGAVAIVLSMIFFLKYAFDNDMIPPIGRVLIGFAVGSGLMYAAHRWMKKGLSAFAQGIVSAATTILYLSAYATYGFYELLPQPIAFLLMVGVTCIAVWRAIAHDSIVIVIMAALGGLTTPAWLSTGEMNTTGLFTYLSLLAVGFYALATWKSTWNVVAYILSVGLSLWWLAWHYSASIANYDATIGSLLMLLTLAIGLGYHYWRSSVASPTTNSLELVHVSLFYGAIFAVLASTVSLCEPWMQHLFLTVAAILPATLTVMRSHRADAPVFNGWVAAIGIFALAANGTIPEDANVGRIIACLAALAGYVFYRPRALVIPLRAALSIAGIALVSFYVASDGALSSIDPYMPLLSLRTLCYTLTVGSVVYIARGPLLRSDPKSDTYTMACETAAWMVAMAFIYIEVRDGVMHSLSARSEHLVYAAHAMGLAATAFAAASTWLVTGYHKSRLITLAAVFVSFIVAFLWIIGTSWFRLNQDYVVLFNVRAGTGLAVSAALSVYFWRRMHSISLVYRTTAVLLGVAITFILASTESTWTYLIGYINADPINEDIILNKLHLVLSSVWIAYGIIVVVFGFIRNVRSIRLGGIALLGLAILKVFLYDLGSLEQPYRIFSFIVLGVILLGASYLYTRYRSIIFGSSSEGSVQASSE